MEVFGKDDHGAAGGLNMLQNGWGFGAPGGLACQDSRVSSVAKGPDKSAVEVSSQTLPIFLVAMADCKVGCSFPSRVGILALDAVSCLSVWPQDASYWSGLYRCLAVVYGVYLILALMDVRKTLGDEDESKRLLLRPMTSKSRHPDLRHVQPGDIQ